MALDEAEMLEHLTTFLNKHGIETTQIDEVLVQYLVGIVLDLDDDSEMDQNVDEFQETLVAYIPGFDKIQKFDVLVWLKHLVNRRFAESDQVPSISEQIVDLNLGFENDCSLEVNRKREVDKKPSLLDTTLKETILSKHGMVPEDDGAKCCQPSLIVKPTSEKTKTRYLDGKVVSTKGERYVNTKKEDSDEMKKTYINLKPLRKYRFH